MNRPISILLVDDDQLVNTCLSTWLEDEGFTVHCVSGGQEALLVLASTHIDVALVDLHMRDMNGEELITNGSAFHPATRFMIHTGKNSYKLPERLRKLGHGVVYKPIVELKSFSVTIRQLVKVGQ